MRKPVQGFPSRSGINWAVQPQKTARGLKFWILEVEGLFCLCSKNKGTDLCLCFRICKFSHDMTHWSSDFLFVTKKMVFNFKTLKKHRNGKFLIANKK